MQGLPPTVHGKSSESSMVKVQSLAVSPLNFVKYFSQQERTVEKLLWNSLSKHETEGVYVDDPNAHGN